MILTADGQLRTIIVYFGSGVCNPSTRFNMASNVHALIYAVNIFIRTKDALDEPLCQSNDIEALLESQSLSIVKTKTSNTAKNRPPLIIFAINKHHQRVELNWI